MLCCARSSHVSPINISHQYLSNDINDRDLLESKSKVGDVIETFLKIKTKT